MLTRLAADIKVNHLQQQQQNKTKNAISNTLLLFYTRDMYIQIIFLLLQCHFFFPHLTLWNVYDIHV